MNASTSRNTHGAKYITAIALLFTLSLFAQTTVQSINGQAPSTGSNSAEESRALYRQGRFDEAAQKYQQLLQAQPRSVEGYAGLARVYLKQKRIQQAHDTITKGLSVVDTAPMCCGPLPHHA